MHSTKHPLTYSSHVFNLVNCTHTFKCLFCAFYISISTYYLLQRLYKILRKHVIIKKLIEYNYLHLFQPTLWELRHNIISKMLTKLFDTFIDGLLSVIAYDIICSMKWRKKDSVVKAFHKQKIIFEKILQSA